MNCIYCQIDSYTTPDCLLCATCRDMFLNDEIDLGIRAHSQGHSVECADQIYRTARCICGLKQLEENKACLK